MLFLPRNGMLVSKTASGQGVFTNVVSQFDQTLSGLVVPCLLQGLCFEHECTLGGTTVFITSERRASPAEPERAQVEASRECVLAHADSGSSLGCFLPLSLTSLWHLG